MRGAGKSKVNDEQLSSDVSESESDESDEPVTKKPSNQTDDISIVKPKENEETDSDGERSNIRAELSTMSFEDLMKLKEELGSKVYNEALFGSTTKNKRVSKTEFKRVNKNRPREMSSKFPVPFLNLAQNKKQNENEIRDPRFDEKCGEYNSKIFKDNYSFVGEIKEKEVVELKNELRKTNDEDKKNHLKFLIQRLENQNREEKKRKLKEEILKEEKEEIKKAKDEGKNPHYRTKKERKTKELVKQYEELKKSGKLRKHLEKRRKKNVSRDRKKFSFD